ncbi:hypothetical protein Pla108_34230 [Botrimarina colliarenosi]|uniref:Retropepsin-like aspartic endopeptidase domain-containing protein n=1 Tax=Botrimarina colliarenosi TaxID=2528001 RepID=A0A5C6A6Z5_9BACT|nr:RimK/LysX family protein [Botrimarina colliarenosi]TWT95279.1 hypothetical protein Pla108_34230 [Botrimarina colliarenosi]
MGNHRLWMRGGLALLGISAIGTAMIAWANRPPSTPATMTIGPVAQITEVSSGVDFLARVDTGAAVSSIHCSPDDCKIEDAAEDPRENIGKAVRLRVENRDGQRAWIETKIDDYAEVRSANGAEHRYRVRLPLKYGTVNKVAIVNLNDRSRMTYRMLLGRDFLAGHFVVDVSQSRLNRSL